MTAEQLQAARAERWRQKQNPALTLDDAATWVNEMGQCLFLPRRNQFVTPAPSFVEACVGAPSDTPSPVEIENARGLMIRLADGGTALPLNLFGAHADQPDFLASREAFPYIFTLRGGRNWKTPPPKASPLVAEIWKLLEPGASLEATEIQAALGRELTEAAVLRGLMELWGGLRVMPVYTQDGPTRWELTQARFSDAMNAANRIAQTTGLSALVSLYLESVIAATPEEIETFLSPLTARSKVREVVNGLAATRQIAIVPVGTQTMYHVAGSLPEFAEPEPAAELPKAAPRSAVEARPGFREERRPFERGRGPSRTGATPKERFAARGGDGGPQRPKPAREDERRPFRKFDGGKRSEGYSPAAGGPRSEGRPKRRPFDDKDRPGGKFPPKKFGAGQERPPKKFGAPQESPAKKFGGKPRFFREERGGTPLGRGRGGGQDQGTGIPQRKGGWKPGGFAKPGKPKPYGTRSGGARPGGSQFRGPREGGGTPPGRGRGEGQDQGTGIPQRKGGWKPGGFAKPGKPKPYGTRSGGARPGGSQFRGPREGGGTPPGRGRGEGQDQGTGIPQRKGGWKPGGSTKSGKPKPYGTRSGGARPGGSQFRGPREGGGSQFGGKPGGGKPAGGKFPGKKFGGPPSRGKSGGGRSGFKSGPKPGGSKPPFRTWKDKKWKNKGKKDDGKNPE